MTDRACTGRSSGAANGAASTRPLASRSATTSAPTGGVSSMIRRATAAAINFNMGTLGGFPNPPARDSAGGPGSVHATSTWEPSEGSQTLPRGTPPGDPAPSTQLQHGNPRRVPKPSREGLRRGTRLRPRDFNMGTLGGFPNPPATDSAGGPGSVHAISTWEPSEGSQTLPRRTPPGDPAPSTRFQHGNPRRVPKPSRDGLRRGTRLRPRDFNMGTLGGFPNPPATDSAGGPGSVHALSTWEPSEGSQTLPRRTPPGDPAPSTRFQHGNPRRVPKPSRDGLRRGTRLRPRAFNMGTLGGFPNPPATDSAGGPGSVHAISTWEPSEGSQTLPRRT